MNTLRAIKHNYRRYLIHWTSRTFASSSTFRMLPRGKSEAVKEWLREEVGDGRDLSRLPNQNRYDSYLKRLIKKLCLNEGLCFGHAAKLMNLYVKALLTRREILSPRDFRQMCKHAHVPLDRIVFDSFWHDFPKCAEKIGLRRHPSIKSISEQEYDQIQDTIRTAAHQERLPAIAYDFCWAIREGEAASSRSSVRRQKRNRS